MSEVWGKADSCGYHRDPYGKSAFPSDYRRTKSLTVQIQPQTMSESVNAAIINSAKSTTIGLLYSLVGPPR